MNGFPSRVDAWRGRGEGFGSSLASDLLFGISQLLRISARRIED